MLKGIEKGWGRSPAEEAGAPARWPGAPRFAGVLISGLPILNPRLQDEFSHLPVADTFAHGRLVNPGHPRGCISRACTLWFGPSMLVPFPWRREW